MLSLAAMKKMKTSTSLQLRASLESGLRSEERPARSMRRRTSHRGRMTSLEWSMKVDFQTSVP